jgi:hypothetical protein
MQTTSNNNQQQEEEVCAGNFHETAAAKIRSLVV